MLSSCFYFGVLLTLPECQARTPTAGHASGSIWATDVPGWITAIGTAALAAGAIFTVIYAIKTFGAQARQVALLVKENNRQAEERRRAQAAGVYIGIRRDGNRLIQPAAFNSSELPVFDAQFWYSIPGGITGPDDLGMIMPGPVGLNGRQMPYDEAIEHAILTFRDAQGARWIRMPGGTLEEQARPTVRESLLEALRLPLTEPADGP
jgi:hypothetical protein